MKLMIYAPHGDQCFLVCTPRAYQLMKDCVKKSMVEHAESTTGKIIATEVAEIDWPMYKMVRKSLRQEHRDTVEKLKRMMEETKKKWWDDSTVEKLKRMMEETKKKWWDDSIDEYWDINGETLWDLLEPSICDLSDVYTDADEQPELLGIEMVKRPITAWQLEALKAIMYDLMEIEFEQVVYQDHMWSLFVSN